MRGARGGGAAATAGKIRPQPVPTRWLMRFSKWPRRAPAPRVPMNQMAAAAQPTVASRPTAQLAMIR